MCFDDDNDAADELKEQQRAREAAIKQGTANINQAFSGFNPEFFESARKASLSTLMPQLNQQYRQNRNAMVFGLGDRGLTRSSTAREGGTMLEANRALGQQIVGNQATENMFNLQRQVATEKGNLLNQLVASQDPNMAAQQAITSASSLSAPSMVAPLGNLFQTFGNAYLARQMGTFFPQPESGGISSFRKYPEPNFASLGKNRIER